ncbi:MAG: SHOCT domain-containing protein [Ruminococcus sp.]|nr:SHOCT domain-containing protein [Ruminococcus sp.]
MNNGSWRCRACGRVNASYVTSCLCGLNQKENEKPREENWKCLVCGRENSKLHKTCVCGATKAGKLPKEAERAAAPVQISAADEIAKFKQLLDSGAITEEEYEAKKKQLLKL